MIGYHIDMNMSDYSFYLNFTPEQFQDYQLKKLKQFIDSIRKFSLYYSKLLVNFKEIKCYEDFGKLPMLGQEQLRNVSLDEMRATDWRNITTVSSSSGTTGKSKLVLWTKEALELENKWNALGYLLMGVSAKSRLAMLMPLELSRCPSYVEACRTIGAFSVPFGRVRNDIEMQNIIEKMKTLGVTHIHGSTSRLLSLTQKAKDLGLKLKVDFNVTHIFGSALFVSKVTRKYLENEWEAQFYDCYGANEVSFVAGECQMHDGLHLLPGMSYIEVVDQNNGKKITDNKSIGEVLITNFSNLGTPLLRYKIGDLGIISYEKCQCGLSFPRLFIKGRTAFSLYIGGTKLDAYEIDSVLSKCPKFSNNYQAIVEKSGSKYSIMFKIECYDVKSVTLPEIELVKRELEAASFEILLKVNEGDVKFWIEILPLGILERTDRDKIKDQLIYREKEDVR